jgi:putative DNA primase/helicase
VELAELSCVKRSITEKVKAFLTARSDNFRPPYGRRTIHVPRSNVFAGSVNDTTPFTDETGNRRFWPVPCGAIDIDALERNRDQLWAEAVQRYENGAAWWLETTELNKLASDEQEARYEPGVWDEVVLKWLENPQQRYELDEMSKTSMPIEPFNSKENEVTITDVLVHGVGKDIEKCTQSDRRQISRCLEHAGWKRFRKSASNGAGGRAQPYFYKGPSQ